MELYSVDETIENLINNLTKYQQRGIIEGVNIEIKPDYHQIEFIAQGGLYDTFQATGQSELTINIKINHNLSKRDTY